jgi:hypothetical protein
LVVSNAYFGSIFRENLRLETAQKIIGARHRAKVPPPP